MQPNNIRNVIFLGSGVAMAAVLVGALIQLSQRHGHTHSTPSPTVSPEEFLYRPTEEPTIFVMESNHATDYYALGTRCDEKTGRDCRVWRISSKDTLTSIRYDRDTNSLMWCGPLNVVSDEPSMNCTRVPTLGERFDFAHPTAQNPRMPCN